MYSLVALFKKAVYEEAMLLNIFTKLYAKKYTKVSNVIHTPDLQLNGSATTSSTKPQFNQTILWTHQQM